MLNNPDQQWRQLSEHYARLCDEELFELAADFDNLTEIAQLTLRDEMKKRRLGDPFAQSAANEPATVRNEPNVALEEAEADAANQPQEYTWKTLLCECKEWNEAWQIRESLQRAGIESWIESTRGYDMLQAGPRIVVPADQLDQARAILAQSIPQGIVAESLQEIPEYQSPTCPKCRAADPVLESADPVNAWHCEACDCRWTEPAEQPSPAR